MRVYSAVTLTMVSAVCLGCGDQAIDLGTRCQWIARSSGLWQANGLNLVIKDPPPHQCPVLVDHYGDPTTIAADVTAPHFTATAWAWAMWDARGQFLTSGVEDFNPSTGGKDLAQASDVYLAGFAGDVVHLDRMNQDQLASDVALFGSSARAIHDAFLPYKCPSCFTVSLTGLPRTKRNQSTTMRLNPNLGGLSLLKYTWFKNGVAFTPPSNPWGIGNAGAVTFKPTTTAPIDWKVIATWGLPQQSKTTKVRQFVDP